MGDETFTFRVEGALKSAFIEAAKAADRSAAQILRGAMRDFLAAGQPAPPLAPGNDWLSAKLGRARASLAAGNGYGEDEMKARFALFRAAARAAADRKMR